jgi:hypothetical protein
MDPKPKKIGTSLEFKTFTGESGTTYLVFKSLDGSFHVFQEVEAKQASRDCGAKDEGNTRQMWQSLFDPE